MVFIAVEIKAGSMQRKVDRCGYSSIKSELMNSLCVWVQSGEVGCDEDNGPSSVGEITLNFESEVVSIEDREELGASHVIRVFINANDSLGIVAIPPFESGSADGETSISESESGFSRAGRSSKYEGANSSPSHGGVGLYQSSVACKSSCVLAVKLEVRSRNDQLGGSIVNEFANFVDIASLTLGQPFSPHVEIAVLTAVKN